MGSEDYQTIGSGALKLKGAKISKKKKKSKSKATDLEKNLSGGEDSLIAAKKRKNKDDSTNNKDEDGVEPKEGEEEEEEAAVVRKTESEQRYEEARKKRLLQMAKASGSRPELLKTHKERVEELNTYLSRMSEHHDMPKIGPG